jgi:hypothetical protein
MADETPGMTPDQARLVLQAALNSPLPRFYVNSFINASSPVDILTVFQCNNQHVFIVNLSYTVAKTLANTLGNLVRDYEARHNLTIPVVGMASTSAPPAS